MLNLKILATSITKEVKELQLILWSTILKSKKGCKKKKNKIYYYYYYFETSLFYGQHGQKHIIHDGKTEAKSAAKHPQKINK